MPRLSDLTTPVLEVACTKCERRGVYKVARLMEKHGDMYLPNLASELSSDCPNRETFTADQCDLIFPSLKP